MDNQKKELIAVGASVVANCQPCLTYHVKKAKEYGAQDPEITEAISIGEMVRKGAMNKMDQFIANFSEGAKVDLKAEKQGCCG